MSKAKSRNVKVFEYSGYIMMVNFDARVFHMRDLDVVSLDDCNELINDIIAGDGARFGHGADARFHLESRKGKLLRVMG